MGIFDAIPPQAGNTPPEMAPVPSIMPDESMTPPTGPISDEPQPESDQYDPTEGDTLKPSEDKQKDILTYCMTRFGDWSTWRADLELDWDKYYLAYCSILDDTNYQWRSKVFVPLTHISVETILPRIIGALFPSDDFFEVNPTLDGSQHVHAAETIKKLLKKQFRNDNLYIKYTNYIKQMTIYGTAIAKVYWKRTEREVKRNVKQYKSRFNFAGFQIGRVENGYKEVTSIERVFDQPTFEPIDIFDFYIDPMATSMEDRGDGMFHMTYKDMEDVKLLGKDKIYMNVDRLDSSPDQIGNLSSTVIDAEASRKYDRQSWRGRQPLFRTKRKQVQILEFWGRYDLDGDGVPEECVFTIGDGRVLLRVAHHPYWHLRPPFIRSVFEPVPGEFYGIGIPEILQSIQDQLNTTVNQRIDNVSLVINRMWLIGAFANVDLTKLKSGPGIGIVADDINQVKPIQTPDVTRSAYEEASTLFDLGQQASGATRFLVGQSTPANIRTARGQAMMTTQSMERFTTTIKYLEDSGIRPLLEMFYQLDLQMMDKEEVIRIIGPSGATFETISPEDIQGNIDFEAVGATQTMNKDIKVQQLMTIMGLMKGMPNAPIPAIMQRIWTEWGYKDGDELFANWNTNMPPEAPTAGEGDANSKLKQMLSQGANNPGSPAGIPGPGGGS